MTLREQLSNAHPLPPEARRSSVVTEGSESAGHWIAEQTPAHGIEWCPAIAIHRRGCSETRARPDRTHFWGAAWFGKYRRSGDHLWWRHSSPPAGRPTPRRQGRGPVAHPAFRRGASPVAPRSRCRDRQSGAPGYLARRAARRPGRNGPADPRVPGRRRHGHRRHRRQPVLPAPRRPPARPAAGSSPVPARPAPRSRAIPTATAMAGCWPPGDYWPTTYGRWCRTCADSP